MALMSTGRWDVWHFSWDDMDYALGIDGREHAPESLVHNSSMMKSILQKMTHPAIANLSVQHGFEWFRLELLSDGLPWFDIARAAIASRISKVGPTDANTWKDLSPVLHQVPHSRVSVRFR